jgi:TatD DNase family protein
VNKITLSEARDRLEELEFRVKSAENERLVAIGECGLDFLRAESKPTRELQLEVLRAHVELARETGLPLSIHCVKAHGPLLEILRERPVPASVMHAYSGSAEIARQLVNEGHYISFAGNLCLANARKAVEAARAVPEDRLLLETDTPDQTPPKRRPAANEPAFIVDVAERLAELRGVDVDVIARVTLDNGRRVFGIEEPFELRPIPDRDHEDTSE